MEQDKQSKEEKIVNFLYEVGSLRRIPRSHRQTLMVNDTADNISSHSFRVAMIGWQIALMEEVDADKVVKMCLIHDVPEIRSGDSNWLHKTYVKVFEDEIVEDQLKNLPFDDQYKTILEYNERKTAEAIVAKDADLLDQILLLKEYEHQGNREAHIWLHGKDNEEKENKQLLMLKTKSAQEIGRKILETTPSDWWKGSWSNKNR